MIMTRADSLLPLAEVTDRLRVSGHGYVGVRSIPLGQDHRIGRSGVGIPPRLSSAAP